MINFTAAFMCLFLWMFKPELIFMCFINCSLIYRNASWSIRSLYVFSFSLAQEKLLCVAVHFPANPKWLLNSLFSIFFTRSVYHKYIETKQFKRY